MGGNFVADDWELASSSNEDRTLVLVGRTGNGKSATGNSIVGEKVFKSKAGSSGVTTFCEMHSAEINDGHIVNVIDTPGLFDNSSAFESLGKEIVKCIDLAKDGIHAVLVVFSVRNRFTDEEETTIRSLATLFGKKIVDYMIVVFTGGDELEDCDQTLEDYLGFQCPKPLKEVLSLCENRCVLFDNKTKDEKKKYEQVQQLLSLVNMVISQNGGKPYTNEYFTELKKNQQREDESLKGLSKGEISEMKIQLQLAHEEQLRKIVEMVVVDMREATKRLEKQLEEEKTSRLEAEENSKKQLKEEKTARLEAEENAKKQLAEEKTARQEAEQKAKKQLAKEKTARLEAEEKAKKQLAEEKTARLEAEEKAKKQLAEEKTAWLEAEEKAKKQLAEEKTAWLEAEQNAKNTQTKSEDEIRKLMEDLKKAHEQLGKGSCVIL